MKKQPVARIQDLLGLLNSLYPPALAEEWDNVGLQVGDPTAELQRVLIALDASEAALTRAEACGAGALLTHHPLIFRPLRSIVPQDETGRVVLRAARSGIGVLCAHTNLDRARAGLNDWLAAALGLGDCQVLAAAHGSLHKLVVYVPAGYEGQVADALFAAGAGHIGGYDGCSFRGEGIGTFRPGAGSTPFRGRVGEAEQVREVRLETVVPAELLSRVLARMEKAHPYEEVAYDLIPLGNRRHDVGLGRIGRLPAAEPLATFAERVKTALGCPALRLVGQAEQTVRKVAVCGGSGASLIAEAQRQGADVLVTGDIKYHEALAAESRGLALVDAGHYPTEQLAVSGMAAALREGARERQLPIEFITYDGRDPFRVV